MSRNPLDGFKRVMIEFNIYRSNELLSTVKGLKNTENGTHRKFIGFYPDVDVQAGDVISSAGIPINYYVTDVDTATWNGKISQIKAYYETRTPQEKDSNSVTYNIQNAPNSIIGNQHNATQNNYVSDIGDLKQMIEQYGNDDKEQLYELANTLEQSLQKDEFKKSKLSKFGDLIAKHSWLPAAIAQLICAFISN